MHTPLQRLASKRILSKLKDFLQLLHGIIRAINRVSNSVGVRVYLIVIASLKALITKEMNVLILSASDVLLSGDMLQTVGLVPAGGENIKRNLATNGEALFHTS